MHHSARSRFVGVSPLALVALTLAWLPGCGSDVGSLFSSSEVLAGSGAAGELGSAGSSSNEAGAPSGGTPVDGAGAPSGAGSAGESQGGTTDRGGSAPGGSSHGGNAGTSNVAGAGGAAPPSVCDSKLVVPDASIATFESGVAGWSAYVDSNPFGLDSSQPGAASSERALRFAGGKAKTSGVYHQIPCSNVSGFDGIQFWAKGKGEQVRFLAVIPATDPNEGVGDCREPEQKCSDHPGMLFSFGDDWQLFRAPFAQLKQYGWGTKASFGSVLNAVLWINDGPVESFDFSIDEVTLYKTAPDK